ncbi:acyltransferase family protein [Serratia quinivorans]|uniref:acyltransferase family protein n=1 Tax=Serratia quinivorans TaxID=137545 RepID=UPI002178737B|nr:acyltransferase [Serratia quinivorans]CAI1645298.1 Acyltransferase family [Serratia quinivorans]CAI1725358.1 Acyltransferase family [Serratia quinivorans]
MQPVKKWSQELEGLRGLASLWVVLGHICILTSFHFPILSDPAIGVDLFILLSGYLMAKNYVERKEKEPWTDGATFKKFWLRRFFRIAPLYYVLLILAIGFGSYFGEARNIIGHFYSETQTNSSRYSDSSFLNVFTHLTFMFGFLPSFSFNTVLPDWSIGLEMQFYFLFPFIMLAVMRLGFARACFAVLLLCVIAKQLLPKYFSSFPMPSMILIKLHLFIVGMFISEAIRSKTLRYAAYALASAFISIYMQDSFNKIRFLAELGMIVMMVAILWPQVEGSRWSNMLRFPRWILTNKVSILMGDVSYSVYLLHLLIVLPIIAFLLSNTKFAELSAVMRFIAASAIILPITYGIAALLYKFIEKPGIKLGKTIINRKQVKAVALP